MLGAIVGDIVGSIYEFCPHKSKRFPLFSKDSAFTDDTVMTLAVAQALMDGGQEQDYVRAMQHLGWLYPCPVGGYGTAFGEWLFQPQPTPYNSWGNGSAMRVSPVAWFYDTLEEVERQAAVSAAVSHNHPEGIKGAQAAAASIFMVRTGAQKRDVQRYITERFGYDLTPTCDDIRPDYSFDVSCQNTVPQAIIAWLDSDCFEDAIRNAVSLGGDSDTLAAITGAIAQADYGIPPVIARQAFQRLDAPLQDICRRFCQRIVSEKF